MVEPVLQFSPTVYSARPRRPSAVATTQRPLFAARVVRELAALDWVVLGYLVSLLTMSIAGEGPRRAVAIGGLTVVLGVVLGGVVLVRSGILRGWVSALAYRLSVFTAVFGSFALLQYILPTARSARLDAEILAFDRALFGFEPAVWLDRFVTTGTVEWFSFFYFGYFFVLAIHVFPFMFAVRDTALLAELAFGFVTLMCVGHVLYVVVPGYGPYQHLAGQFEHELDGPLWWHLVRATVDAGEVTARTDIFPSLHTGAPAFLTLFSFRHRARRPFRYTWLPLGLFTSQIVISTMFLRWHYLIDVIAGLALATVVSVGAARLMRWEAEHRAALGRSPAWLTFGHPKRLLP